MFLFYINKMIFLLFTILVLWGRPLSASEGGILMLADLVQSMHRPTSIMATVCWDSKMKIELFAALTSDNSQYFTMMRYFSPDRVPERHYPDQQIVFVVDIQCQNIIQYLEQSSKLSHFRSPFRWLIVGSEVVNSSTLPVPVEMADIDIFPDAEVIVAYENNNTFILECVYRISSNSSWKSERFGTWNHVNGLTISKKMQKPPSIRRLNLEGFVIPICYVITDNESLYHLMDRQDDHIDTLTKVNFPTSNHLLDFLNADRQYIFANTWGYLVNGTWSGMTGYMVRGEVEIGGSPMFFTSERMSFVDYISSPTPTRSKFVFQQPKLSYENNLFLLSFETSVWISIGALLIILILTILAVVLWEGVKFKDNKERNHDAGILRADVSDIIVYIFGAACQQGSTVELKGSLGRVVLLILLLTFIFLYTSYSANIVALLQSSSSKIHNLDDLLHSRLKFGVDDTIFNRYYFSTASEPIRKAIYETKIAPPGIAPRFMSLEEGIKKMQKGLFAFHMETGVGYKFVGKYFHEGKKCGLKEIQYLQVIDPFLAVRKNTPYKEMFKIGIQRIKEHGLQSRENQLLYTKKPKCTGQGGNFVSVSMVDCYPALLVLVYGAIGAVILLLLEILVHRKQKVLQEIYVFNLFFRNIETHE